MLGEAVAQTLSRHSGRWPHSDAAAPVNAAMAKRAYQISDYTFTGLPQKADELFEPAPAPAPATTPAPAPAPDEKKTGEVQKPAASK